jgi:hypothetical protein
MKICFRIKFYHKLKFAFFFCLKYKKRIEILFAQLGIPVMSMVAVLAVIAVPNVLTELVAVAA